MTIGLSTSTSKIDTISRDPSNQTQRTVRSVNCIHLAVKERYEITIYRQARSTPLFHPISAQP